MPKVLSQAGSSLADVYDVAGSIAGVEELLSKEVPLVHDMASTIFSERLAGQIVRVTPGAIAQNVAWDEIYATFQGNFTRILDCVVITDDATRIDRATVLVRDPILGREIPIWMFDDTIADVGIDIRIVQEGAAVGASFALNPALKHVPSMLFGDNQPYAGGRDIAFRGTTTAFGAGTVIPVLLLYIGYAETQGVSSHGLPIPGW